MGSSEGTFDTKLHEAVRYSDIEGVKVALQQEYDPNLIGLYQWSPLHEAAHNGDAGILKLLLAKKGNPNKADYSQGRTAMHYAAERGHVECLKMLVDAGGRYDIKDDSGKDSLDLVTPGGRKLLERLKVRDLMLMSTDASSQHEQTLNTSLEQSHDSSHDLSLSRRSSQDSAFGERKPVLGYVTMSVEYHSNKGTMKIRVWQITDLLLPPPNTSMIHTIYVKSYLFPDKKKESKRKTEEVKVEGSEGHMHLKKRKDKLSVQHVFTPVSFKFSKALEYSGISADIIREKQLQIEVCITQRYSHRSFLIGMVLLPLKTAVKKVVKEKYALIPCMNHTIPSNMRVYCASELHITSSAADVFYSSPNVRVVIPEDIDDSSEKAVSNPDLKNEYSSSVEVDMSENTKIVPKLDFTNLTLDESGYASEHHITISGELESPDSGKNKDILHEVRAHRTVVVEDKGNKELFKHVEQKVSSHDKSVNKLSTCEVIEIEFGESDPDTPKEIKIDQGRENIGQDRKSQENKKPSKDKSVDHSNSGSRPETPTWDYYDIPNDSPSIVVESFLQGQGSAPVLFPMETTLQVRKIEHEEKVGDNKREKDRSKRRSKKKQEPIPGKAVPLIPQIVVVSPEENLKKQGIDETRIDVPALTKPLPLGKSNNGTSSTVVNITKTDPIKQDSKKSILREVAVVKPQTTKLKEAKVFIPKIKATDLPHTKSSQPHAPPRPKKTTRLKERKEKELFLNQSSINIDSSGSNLQTGSSSAPVFSTDLENINFQRSVSETLAFNRSLSSTSNSSVVVDIDKLSFASSDSHVVELDEDISITELQDDSDLFSTSSKIESSISKDIESGIEEFTAEPERFSPTKQVMPMQVFIEESFDSSDDTLSHSYTKNLPLTEL